MIFYPPTDLPALVLITGCSLWLYHVRKQEIKHPWIDLGVKVLLAVVVLWFLSNLTILPGPELVGGTSEAWGFAWVLGVPLLSGGVYFNMYNKERDKAGLVICCLVLIGLLWLLLMSGPKLPPVRDLR